MISNEVFVVEFDGMISCEGHFTKFLGFLTRTNDYEISIVYNVAEKIIICFFFTN